MFGFIVLGDGWNAKALRYVQLSYCISSDNKCGCRNSCVLRTYSIKIVPKYYTRGYCGMHISATADLAIASSCNSKINVVAVIVAYFV